MRSVITTNKITSILERLTFDKVYLADNSEIRGLLFDRRLVVRLKDGSSYTLVLAEDGERSFLRVRGSHEVSRVEIAADIATLKDECKPPPGELIKNITFVPVRFLVVISSIRASKANSSCNPIEALIS